MKLHSLYEHNLSRWDGEAESVLRDYLRRLRALKSPLTENNHAKEGMVLKNTSFGIVANTFEPAVVDKAVKAGQFDDPSWVEKLLRGMKQAGVHGINEVAGVDRLVTGRDLTNVVTLLLRYFQGK